MNKQDRVKQIIKEEIQKFVSEMSVMSGGAVEGVSGSIEEEPKEEKPIVESVAPRDILADLNQMQQMMDSWMHDIADSMENAPEGDRTKHFMISKVVGKINAGIDNLKYLLGAKE